ncbi:ubiquilin-1-like [Alligator mississippiensis]|uniref:ubiquilin-1-like n=1 Tax=Alligator mississippiensis TaxID=8496 RepID=UPI00287810A7|nr:ubiquilin-1-like [Alligator mississippiensis]
MAESGESVIACPVVAANPHIIRVTVKTPRVKEEFVVPENNTIQQFKEEISKHFHCQTSQLVLVCMGRILKDQDTLRQWGIHDGITVHLVIRTHKRSQDDLVLCRAATPAPMSSLDTSPASSAYDLVRQSPASLEAKALGTELQTQPPLRPHAEAAVPTVENLFIHSMLSNPELMRQLILANPQMQQLAQQIPEIGHVLNDTDMMREMLDMVRNPDTGPDTRGPDQAASCLESIPGGDNPLRGAYVEPPEPILGAAPDPLGRGPLALLVRNSSAEEVARDGLLPCVDAWDHSPPPSVSQSATSICSTSTYGDPESSVVSCSSGPISRSCSVPSLGHGAGTFPLGGLQSLAQQIAETPQLIANLCSCYTKCMVRWLIQSAQGAVLAAENGPPSPEQVPPWLPSVFWQSQSPEMLAAVCNPKAMHAWAQIEQGLQTLVAEAPVLLPWLTPRLWGLGNAGSSLSCTVVSLAQGDPSRPVTAASEQRHRVSDVAQMLQALPGTDPQHLPAPEVKFQEELD